MPPAEADTSLPDMARARAQISGTLVKGHQVASGVNPESPFPDSTIRLQLPHFAARGLELDGVFAGTLNLSIAPATFELLKPEVTLRDLVWLDRFHPEDFSFLRCQLAFGHQSYCAWLYYPHPQTKTMHFHDNTVMELLARKIADIGYGDTLTLGYDPSKLLIRHP